MKIIFDTDGTVTDFNKFLQTHAYKHFMGKYDMKIVNPKGLELEEIFDMENFFMEKDNCSKEEAIFKTKKALDKYWIGFNFVKFSLLNKFRDNVNEFINNQKSLGHDIQIHTSRSKTANKDMLGVIARDFTIGQYLFNGINISKDKFHFYPNDEAKIQGIIKSKPDVVFEDKPSIIEALNEENIKVVCVKGNHNDCVNENENVKIINDYMTVEDNVEKLLGKDIYDVHNLLAKSEKTFKKYYDLILAMIKQYFKPEVLNIDNLIKNPTTGVVYAPNHMSTLDVFPINYAVDDIVHWAGLARFMRGEDSIFNNSKNPILCYITKVAFTSFGFFPVERSSDCEHPDNVESLKNMKNALLVGNKVGLFPEGTTRKEEGKDFGTFKKGFCHLAQQTNSYIQPITIYWYKKNDKKCPIINFGQGFPIADMTIDEAMEKYSDIQQNSMSEIKTYIENKSIDNQKTKKM